MYNQTSVEQQLQQQVNYYQVLFLFFVIIAIVYNFVKHILKLIMRIRHQTKTIDSFVTLNE